MNAKYLANFQLLMLLVLVMEMWTAGFLADGVWTELKRDPVLESSLLFALICLSLPLSHYSNHNSSSHFLLLSAHKNLSSTAWVHRDTEKKG